MDRLLPFACVAMICGGSQAAMAETASVSSPDGRIVVTLDCPVGGTPTYAVTYDGKDFLLPSPLGLETSIGDFSKSMTMTGHKTEAIERNYQQSKIKKSDIDYAANQLVCTLKGPDKQKMDVEVRVSDSDVAFRYTLPRQNGRTSVRIDEELTGFRFPEYTTTFLCPQSDAMVGWKRTKPSYEEEYEVDVPLMETKSSMGHGFTFPCLFKVGADGWMLVGETDVDSRYCASHLSDVGPDGLMSIAFPMAEENNGLGSVAPAFSLPGSTPWRTITVGDNLKPIVETTVPWDLVEPRYDASCEYNPGKGTWSWIMWQDQSINIEDQKTYADLAAALGYQYFLIDNWWDTNIGHDRIPELAAYARSQGVEPIMWYSSSGYWNDIEQGPINRMDNSIVRKREMKWLQDNGIKAIKVDFFGGDKQETMRLYEQILSDADDHGIMVIFHGCTMPRGWERMYPNYIGSEAVLASENLIFTQHACDTEAFNATLHPFIRNSLGCMEFGGVMLNKRLNRGNDGGSIRRTGDVFQLATAVLFQNPAQNFAIAPNNLTDAPAWTIDFMKEVPTEWDDIEFIDGYPGQYVVLARRAGDKWYVAGVNATDSAKKLELELPMMANQTVTYFADPHEPKEVKVGKNGKVKVEIAPNGGILLR